MLVFVVPALLMALLYWILIDTPLFGRIAHAIFALFPFLVMFMVASITTLRERRSGTLERTLTMPVSRGAFIAGYALAFSLLSLVQTLITVGVCVAWLGVEVDGSLGTFFGIVLLDALVGTAAGLTASAFARTEFQIVQFVPAVVVPQFLLCGLLVPRADMPRVLELISAAMPVSYAVDAMQTLGGMPAQVISSIMGCGSGLPMAARISGKRTGHSVVKSTTGSYRTRLSAGKEGDCARIVASVSSFRMATS